MQIKTNTVLDHEKILEYFKNKSQTLRQSA